MQQSFRTKVAAGLLSALTVNQLAHESFAEKLSQTPTAQGMGDLKKDDARLSQIHEKAWRDYQDQSLEPLTRENPWTGHYIQQFVNEYDRQSPNKISEQNLFEGGVLRSRFDRQLTGLRNRGIATELAKNGVFLDVNRTEAALNLLMRPVPGYELIMDSIKDIQTIVSDPQADAATRIRDARASALNKPVQISDELKGRFFQIIRGDKNAADFLNQNLFPFIDTNRYPKFTESIYEANARGMPMKSIVRAYELGEEAKLRQAEFTNMSQRLADLEKQNATTTAEYKELSKAVKQIKVEMNELKQEMVGAAREYFQENELKLAEGLKIARQIELAKRFGVPDEYIKDLDPEKIETAYTRIALGRAVGRAFGQAISLLDPEGGRIFEAGINTMMSLAECAAVPVSPLNWVNFVSSIFSLFGSIFGGPDQAEINFRKEVLKRLEEIQKTLEIVRREMHQRFDRVENALFDLRLDLQDVQARLDDVVDRQMTIEDKLVSVLNYLGQINAQTSHWLIQIRSGVKNLENKEIDEISLAVDRPDEWPSLESSDPKVTQENEFNFKIVSLAEQALENSKMPSGVDHTGTLITERAVTTIVDMAPYVWRVFTERPDLYVQEQDWGDGPVPPTLVKKFVDSAETLHSNDIPGEALNARQTGVLVQLERRLSDFYLALLSPEVMQVATDYYLASFERVMQQFEAELSSSAEDQSFSAAGVLKLPQGLDISKPVSAIKLPAIPEERERLLKSKASINFDLASTQEHREARNTWYELLGRYELKDYHEDLVGQGLPSTLLNLFEQVYPLSKFIGIEEARFNFSYAPKLTVWEETEQKVIVVDTFTAEQAKTQIETYGKPLAEQFKNGAKLQSGKWDNGQYIEFRDATGEHHIGHCHFRPKPGAVDAQGNIIQYERVLYHTKNKVKAKVSVEFTVTAQPQGANPKTNAEDGLKLFSFRIESDKAYELGTRFEYAWQNGYDVAARMFENARGWQTEAYQEVKDHPVIVPRHEIVDEINGDLLKILGDLRYFLPEFSKGAFLSATKRPSSNELTTITYSTAQPNEIELNGIKVPLIADDNEISKSLAEAQHLRTNNIKFAFSAASSNDERYKTLVNTLDKALAMYQAAFAGIILDRLGPTYEIITNPDLQGKHTELQKRLRELDEARFILEYIVYQACPAVLLNDKGDNLEGSDAASPQEKGVAQLLALLPNAESFKAMMMELNNPPKGVKPSANQVVNETTKLNARAAQHAELLKLRIAKLLSETEPAEVVGPPELQLIREKLQTLKTTVEVAQEGGTINVKQ